MTSWLFISLFSAVKCREETAARGRGLWCIGIAVHNMIYCRLRVPGPALALLFLLTHAVHTLTHMHVRTHIYDAQLFYGLFMVQFWGTSSTFRNVNILINERVRGAHWPVKQPCLQLQEFNTVNITAQTYSQSKDLRWTFHIDVGSAEGQSRSIC